MISFQLLDAPQPISVIINLLFYEMKIKDNYKINYLNNIMSQRLYVDYDRALCDSDQNVYRQKASKMTQIQSYVNVLIENNRVYADELNALKRQNTDLRSQIEHIMGDFLRQKQKYEQSLKDTKTQYTKQVGRLIEELKDILHKKEQMQGSYKSLLQELTYQSQFDKKSRGIQIDEIERNYENKIRILNDRINEQNRQIQKNFYLQSDSKMRMVKQIDGLNYDVCELKKQNNDLRQAHLFDEDQIARLSNALKNASKDREDLGVNLLKVEQDKNNQIIQLKQGMGLLRQQLNDQVDNIKKFETALSTKEKELQSMTEKHDMKSRSKSECQDENMRLSMQLNEKNNELADLKQQYQRLTQFSNKEIRRMSELIRVLETDNKKMLMEKQEAEDQSRIKQEQIYTLLNQIRGLEGENQTLNSKSIKIEELNMDLNRQVTLLRDEIESVMLQLKNQTEKCHLQMNHITTLEQMVEKEKRRNGYLESANVDKEIAARQIPSDLSQKYELEIKEVMRRSENEKSQMAQKFDLENERLIRMYEKALRQKELLFKEKIMVLETEIRNLS